MTDSISSCEFIGRFGVSYKDGEAIYAYDELTHGLYKFSLNLKEVTFVLSPMSIHKNTLDRIIGISKSKNEIILIPSFLDSEWIFYDEEKENIRYESPIKNRIHISGAITNGSNLFLIPFDTYDPVIIFLLDGTKRIKMYENWYRKNRKKSDSETNIWGAFSYTKFVFFPVINSNYICCMDTSNVKIIALNIPCSILSVSIYNNNIWILPVAGKYIYVTNIRGDVTDRLDLSKTEPETSANDFVRIVATEANVFLLPISGKRIWVYQCKENKFVQIELKDKTLWGRMFVSNPVPYWDFIIENEKLYLLPSDYRLKSIELNSLVCNSYSLKYSNNIDNNKYLKMMWYVQKKCVYGEYRNDLEEFVKFLPYLQKNFTGQNVKIGRQIWEYI